MNRDQSIENVLVLQGGGSLGAFGCGVFKALAESRVKIDIVAGTSIGGVNAAIIAGSQDKWPEVALEQFWLELAENSINFMPQVMMPSIVPSLPANNELESYYSRYYQQASVSFRHTLSFYSSSLYGNSMMFVPRWRPEYSIKDPKYFRPHEWTYIYDHSPLASTLEKYINYDKLRPGGNPDTRLIITAVNVLTAEPMTFDSSRQQITVKHLLGTSGYPFYGFPWVEVEKGVYMGWWPPEQHATEGSDRCISVTDKQVMIVENYPKKIERLPENLPEVMHRARDIVFSDKIAHNIKMSKAITRHLEFIEELYKIVENNVDPSKIDRQKMDNIHKKYEKMMKKHGAEIKRIAYITREEPFPHLYENTDFTPAGIKNLIMEGESKTKQALQNIRL